MYTYKKHGKRVSIISYNGNEEIVKIPTEIDGFTVTTIDSLAFFGNEEIKEIFIPKGITIKQNAITFCPNLEKVILEGNNKVDLILSDCDKAKIIINNETTFKQIYKFVDENKVVNLDIFETKEVGEFIKIIGIKKAYVNKLSKLIIPNYIDGKKVMYLSEKLFEKKAFEEVILNDFIDTIPDYCFYCSNVKKVSHMDNIKVIGAFAFAFTDTNTDTFLDNVEEIRESAFNCNPMNNLCFSEKLTKLENRAFAGTFVKEIDLSRYKGFLKEDLFISSNVERVILPITTIKIPKNCFCGCSYLKYLDNTENIEFLDEFAFYDCGELSLNLNFKKIVSIEQFALSGVNITNLQIDIGDIKLSDGAFSGVKGITKVVFTNKYNLDNIPISTFHNSSVKIVELNSNIKRICSEAFSSSSLETINLENIEVIEANAFEHCEIIEAKLPSLITLKEFAFYYCDNLKNLDLSKNCTLKTIEKYSFYSTGIEELKFGSSLEVIEEFAFYNISKLTELILPKTLKKVGRAAFCYAEIANLSICGETEFCESFCSSTITNLTIGDIGKVNGFLVKSMKISNLKIYVSDGIIPKNFFNNIRLKTLRIIGLITHIEEAAFKDACISQLEMNTHYVKEIEKEAFYCANISNLKIIVTAEKYGKDCYGLVECNQSILDFDNAKEIDKCAFSIYNNSHKEIHVILNQENINVGTNNFENPYIKLHVKKDLYKKLKNRVFFKDNITNLSCLDTK